MCDTLESKLIAVVVPVRAGICERMSVRVKAKINVQDEKEMPVLIKKMRPNLGCILAALIVVVLGGCATNKEVLHRNVKEQDITRLEQNIKRGVDINEKDGYGFTPLILAAYYNYGPLVKYLCENGANINAQNNDGWSALLYAVNYGYDDTFNILMQHEPDLNLVNKQGYNAIWYAEKYDRKEMYRKLEEAGTKRVSE